VNVVLLAIYLFGMEPGLRWKNFPRISLFFPETNILLASLHDGRVGPQHQLFMVLFVTPLDILLDDALIGAIPICQLTQQMLVFLLIGH
jgi:hypothetical protein